jgi:hypothetical protein
MYPPRPEPSIKERQESGQRILDIFLAIFWTGFGIYTIRFGNDPGYGAFLMSIGIPPATEVVLRKRGVSKERRQVVVRVEAGVLVIALLLYVVYRHLGS